MASENRIRPEPGGRLRRAGRWRLAPQPQQRRKRFAEEDPTATDVLPAAPPPTAESVPSRPAASPTDAEKLAENIERAAERVRDGLRRIEHQRALIFDLRRRGVSSEEAEKIMRSMQNLQREHEKVLATMQSRLRRHLREPS